jgi:preprotein translocase subunit SecA
VVRIAAAGQEKPVPDSAYDGLSEAQFALCRSVVDSVRQAYEIKVGVENPDALRAIERFTILSAIDKLWQEHLYNMDSLRNSIGLRAYGQRDPLIEYKAEAFTMFNELMVNIKSEVCHNIFRSASSLLAFESFLRKLPKRTVHSEASAFGGAQPQPAAPASASDIVSEVADEVSRPKPARVGPKVGRNDPCPCGSGKKYKQCCGKH